MDYKALEKKIEAILAEDQASLGTANVYKTSSVEHLAIEEMSKEVLGPQTSDWQTFNTCFGSFRPREFTVLCGTTGAGKTQFLANLSMQLITSSTPHFVASVETGPVDYMIRLLGVLEGKDLNCEESIPKEVAQEMFKKWKPILRRDMLYFSPYQTKVSPKRLMCDLLYAHEQHGCRIAFIDNLNFLMPIVNQAESNSSMDRIVHDFIIFCKNVDMHILMVMHPKKKEDKDGFVRVDNEYDVKGSSTVVQEAHNVILLNRPTQAQSQEGYSHLNHREIKFAKLRRRGRYIGNKIMFKCVDSRYLECV